MGMCFTRSLAKIGNKILSLPATSAAAERSFSTYANVYSAKRNRLGNDVAGKIVYIAQNLKLQNQCVRETPESMEVLGAQSPDSQSKQAGEHETNLFVLESDLSNEEFEDGEDERSRRPHGIIYSKWTD